MAATNRIACACEEVDDENCRPGSKPEGHQPNHDYSAIRTDGQVVGAKQHRDRLMTLLEVRAELRPSWRRGLFGGRGIQQ